MAEGPIIPSYAEAYLMAPSRSPGIKVVYSPVSNSKAPTERYASPGARSYANKARSFVDGDGLSAKPISVLNRPVKNASKKNAENLDAQHERDSDAFERRANGFRRLAQNPYHHNAPPGSILTTFEKGNIVDRGRGKSAQHEAKGVYDPVNHVFKVPASPSYTTHGRPLSAPHTRGYAQIHGGAAKDDLAYSAQLIAENQPSEPIALGHKRLQAARGVYNPLTHKYTAQPEAEYINRKEVEFKRNHELASQKRRISPRDNGLDPIIGEPKSSPGADRPSSAFAAPEPIASPEPSPRPSSRTRVRHMQGESWGTYDPIKHEWKVPPRDTRYTHQEALNDRQRGVTGQSMGRSVAAPSQGIYNPILNEWTVLPADPRHIDGLSFKPTTVFTRPTPASIRM